MDLHEKILALDNTNHELVKDTLAQFFLKLSRIVNPDHRSWLESIEIILSRFPKYCLTHRNTIEKYLIQFLDSDREYFVIGAGKCCHALQQVKPVNEKSANAKTCWREQMSLLCATAHSLMSAAFADAVDIFKSTGYFQTTEANENIATTPIAEALSQLTLTHVKIGAKNDNSDVIVLSPAQKNSLLCKRLKNVLTFIQAMLVEVYPVAKPVRPQMILDTIVRALSVTSATKTDSMKESDRKMLSDNMADVKVHTLRTLDALIMCLGSNLIPYSPLVFRLAAQTLRWTSENASKETRVVRRASYASLSLWLTTLRVHKLETGTRGRGALDETLVAAILDDVTPRVNTVQLTMSNQSMKNLSKKARRKMANRILDRSAIASHIPGEKNRHQTLEEDPVLVVSALGCLEVFLRVCGIFLKPAVHKKVQDALVRACYNVPAACDVAVGVALCRCLEAARICVSSSVPPPTHHCLSVYSRLLNSSHPEISQFCSQALLSIRMSLLGVPPSLTAAPQPLASEEVVERTNFMSERNRAALVSLLGEDNFPTPQISEEIININESPNRKRKLEDDKISVSSQSSIEVQIDETNGVDLDSPTSDLGEVVENETDFTSPSSMINGKMRLLDFDKKNKDDRKNIHDLETQLPNTSAESVPAVDDDSNQSIEVSYDHSGNKGDEIKYLEKIDGDNLPSTGETDDIQLTCGQTIKSSQESVKSSGKKISKDVDESIALVRVESRTEMEIDTEEIIDVTEGSIEGDEVKVTDGKKNLENNADTTDKVDNINVEDMLADFVDEKA